MLQHGAGRWAGHVVRFTACA